MITLRPGATRAAICKHPLLIDAGSAADVSWTYGQVLAETMTPSSVARSSASTCSGVPRAAARARACRLPHRTPCRHHLRTSSSHIVTAVATARRDLLILISKHTSLLATAVTTGTMCEDDVRMRRQARALAAARGTPEQVLAEERATLEGVFVMKPQCLYMSFAPSYTQSYIEVRTTGP